MSLKWKWTASIVDIVRGPVLVEIQTSISRRKDENWKLS